MLDGKGQFRCGNRNCEEPNELRSWEVNFAYVEHGEKKNALVKLREYLRFSVYILDHLERTYSFRPLGLCPKCSDKLNYRSKKREVKRMRRRERRAKATKHKSRARSCRECSVERNTSEESTTEEPINDPTDSDDRVEHFTSSEPQNFENNWTKGWYFTKLVLFMKSSIYMVVLLLL